MKTRLLIIFAIAISVVSAIIVGFFALSNDPQYSKENPYGFSAQVFYSEHFLPIMCPTQNDCSTHLQLNIWSDVPAILQGYKICNGFSCVIKDNMAFSTKDSTIIPIFDGNKWNIGDKVSIKVQVVTQYDENYTHPFPIPFYIDLGESEIIEYGLIEPTDARGHCGEKYLVVGNDECVLNPEFIEPNTIIIYDVVENGGTRLAVTPSQMVMNLTNGNNVTFVNDGSTTVNIFDNSKGIWRFDNVKPSSQRTLIINETGFYEFLIQNSLHGEQGRIAALSDDTNSLLVGVRAKMAQTIIGSHFGETNDWLISVSAGGLNPGITIGIDEKFQDKYDDAEKFYYEKYRKMIPFNVPITIEFSTPIVPQDNN